MTPKRIACILFALATTVQAAASPVVEIDWITFRHYIAAHAWIADIDFRDGEVQGMHVCVGFNAFNHYADDPSKMTRYGFESAASPSPTLQAAAFAVAMNSRAVMREGVSFVRAIRESDDYRTTTGEERLAHARDALWRQVTTHSAVKEAVEETLVRLEALTTRLVDAQLLSPASLPEDPLAYMLGMSSLLMNTEVVGAILAEESFLTLPDAETRRRHFAREFSGRVAAASGIDDEEQRDGYMESERSTMTRMFDARGSYVVRLKP